VPYGPLPTATDTPGYRHPGPVAPVQIGALDGGARCSYWR
jgi:hypothetical protein